MSEFAKSWTVNCKALLNRKTCQLFMESKKEFHGRRRYTYATSFWYVKEGQTEKHEIDEESVTCIKYGEVVKSLRITIVLREGKKLKWAAKDQHDFDEIIEGLRACFPACTYEATKKCQDRRSTSHSIKFSEKELAELREIGASNTTIASVGSLQKKLVSDHKKLNDSDMTKAGSRSTMTLSPVSPLKKHSTSLKKPTSAASAPV